MQPPLMLDPVRRWTVMMGIWTAIGVFFVLQGIVRRLLWDLPMNWGWTVGYELLYWWVWAVLAPAALWLARREPVQAGQRLRTVVQHSLFAIVLGGAHALLMHGLMLAIWGPPRDRQGAVITFDFYLTHELPIELFTGFYKYWLIVLIYWALLYQKKYRERELAAAQLESKLSQAQLQALKMQLHPHFLFNTLHAVSMLNFTDVDAANRMLVQLSDLLRITLENSGAQEVRLRQELDFLRRYLEIEQTRFQDRLTVEVEADPKLLDAQVPNLILQPLVENAIRHGLGRQAGSSRLSLRARRQENDLVLEVTDDGPGLPAGWDLQRDAGIGLSNTSARLAQLYGDRHRFELLNRDAGGLTVRITLPLSFGPGTAGSTA